MYISPWAWVVLAWIIIIMNLFWVPAARSCEWKYCQNQIVGDNPVRPITNTHRQRVGDIYDPGHGRLQIRNNSRQIIGYIERNKMNTKKEPK